VKARVRLILVISSLLLLTTAAPALGGGLPPGGTFWDDDGIVEEGYIEAIRSAGITQGCNPPINDFFCPERTLTRGEMATVFVRALDLPRSSANLFTDTSESVHVNSINALAEAGITKGCNPPENTEFCPNRQVTRGEMAAFIARAFAV